jgi:hypothetical protein
LKYTIDDDTRSLLEEVLQLAQRMVDLQYNDDVADDLQLILNETADRFGITTTELILEDNGQGTVTITVKSEEPTQSLPDTRPKLVTVDGKFKEPLPPGFSQKPDEE